MRQKQYKIFIILLTFLSFTSTAFAQQIKGLVRDAKTNEPLMYVSIFYKKIGKGTTSNMDGEFVVNRYKGANELTFSVIGYKTKVIKVSNRTKHLDVKLSPDNILLNEVTIKPKKEKYSRKNNPAVELMKKVISHKKSQRLEQYDFYQYDKYEKMKMSINDLKPEQLEKGIFKKYPFIRKQVEVSKKTNNLILPISIKETASKTIFRKDPKDKKTIIEGFNSSGIEEFFSTGDMLGTVLKDVFADVNIYENNIDLLQRRFVSPIGNSATRFYKFYIMDTLKVEKEECIHLTFVPQNSQDFGFTGHIYVLKDSTYAVKRCKMNLPVKTGVNFVNYLNIEQDYQKLPNGNWVIKNDDMTVDLSWNSKKQMGLQVVRSTTYNNYKFDPIDKQLFKFKGDVLKRSDMLSKNEKYWNSVRKEPLTHKESGLELFIKQLEEIPSFKYIIFSVKALIENFVETGSKEHPSKIDIGPINTMISHNYVDGTRFRLSAMSTANLDPHWFFSGYGAYGLKDHKWKYRGEVTYSFEKRDYVVWEYPKHYIQASYQYDVMSPMDKFLFTDKDNVFLALKATTVDQMSYIRDATINYELEGVNGWGLKAMIRNRNDEPAGNLHYIKNKSNKAVHDITTTEVSATLRFAPGESFVNSKQRRIPVSLDAPILTLTHTMGLKNVLGGEYNFNRTQASFWKRVWLPSSWGKVDFSLKAGAVWDKVPFPLLILPEANLSYITQRETFCLINNMEFLNDRFASLSISYDMNGKLFNRIPLLRKLKWREMFRVRTLWGTLTDKNNPFKSNDESLFKFPQRNGEYTSFVMDKKIPYVEASIGIYNIFKLLHIEYVHRFTYLDHPNINKNGIRFMVLMIF